MPWYAFDLGPDVEVFFPWEGGYEDAKIWTLDHGLCFSEKVSGKISPRSPLFGEPWQELSAVVEIIFCVWFPSDEIARKVFSDLVAEAQT